MSRVRWVAAAGLTAVISLAAPALPVGPVAAAADPVIAAAGDIACAPSANRTAARCHQADTARLLTAGSYTAVLPLGDTQYNCGAPSEYPAYDRSWGLVKNISHPIVGDNEYVGSTCSTPGAAGYFGYFGALASPDDPACTSACRGYYSYDIGAWHVIALNSECTQPGVGGCAVGSPQHTWLQKDLAAHRNLCTLAYIHKPLWGNSIMRNKVKPLVQALYNGGAEVLLSGHDHLYVRFAPQNMSSKADANGIRQFVVGSGGVNHGKVKPSLPNTQYKNNTQFGVLRLVLHAGSYDWAFLPDTGGAALDSGTGTCH